MNNHAWRAKCEAQQFRYTVPYTIYRHATTRAEALKALRLAVRGFVRAWDFNFKHNETNRPKNVR